MSRIYLCAPDRPAAEFEASPVYSILVAAQRAGVPLRHDCGGKAQCGTCRVKVVAGKLSPMGERERQRLEAVGALTGKLDNSGISDESARAASKEKAGPVYRLACQSRPGSDLELEAVLPLDRKE